MRKVWFIAIMAVCMALGTGCGRFQAAGEPDSEMVSAAEKSGAEEGISQDYGFPEPESREETTDIYPYCEKKVLVQREEGLALELEELPRLVWRENVRSGEESYELVFERVSPGYQKLFVEAGEWFADYRLTVKDGAGNVIASQVIVNYAIPFEEAYWLEDFSGDGMADLAFCTEKIVGTSYFGSTLDIFIWNEENKCYEHKELPEVSWDDCPFCPSWNRKESVIIEPSGLRNAPDFWDMYAFVDGQWQRIRRLEPEYEIDEVGYHWTVGYREIFYQDGEVQEERYLEETDLEEKRESIWFENENVVDLHTFGREWTRVSETIGGRTIDKEVRNTEGSQN